MTAPILKINRQTVTVPILILDRQPVTVLILVLNRQPESSNFGAKQTVADFLIWY
jgi:hypothetical protein